jgi:hypothetical protein
VTKVDPETKQQSSLWKSPQSPRAKKAWQVQSSAKSILIVFFDVKGIVHHESVPPKMMVNCDFYCDVLRRLKENIRQKTPELWRYHNWLLHHDNAPARTHVPENHRVLLLTTTWLSFHILPTRLAGLSPL